LAYLLVWSLCTATMVGACWLGLRSVVDAAVPQRTAPFSAAELGRANPSPSVSEGNGAQPATVPLAETQAQPPTTAPVVTPTPTPVPTTSAPPAAPAANGVPVSGWVAVSNGRGGTAYTRTFVLQGGEVAFVVDAYDVHVTDVDLRPGYALVPTRYDYRSLLVSLISNDRASRVYVAWRGGPYAEITEAID
jgi:hypothetical protein